MTIAKLALLKPLDILAYRPRPSKDLIGRFIATMSRGKYAHIAIYIGNGLIIESHIDSGVARKPLNPKWYPVVDVYRYKHRLETYQKDSMSIWLESQIGKPYDLLAFPSTFIRSVVAKVFHADEFRKDKPIFNSNKAFYCSELGASMFNYIGIKINRKVNSMSTTPSDMVADRGQVKRIC